MGDFKDYYSSHVTISKFPIIQNIQAGIFDGCKCRINVSDIYRPEIDNAFREMGVHNFWFPFGEAFGMALESLYGALRIMWQAEKQKQSLLIHCNTGKNRSVMVADSYYFLRTQRHREHSQPGLAYARNIRNQLLLNIDDGQLPGIYKMEEFLQSCRESFDISFSEKDRPMDWIKHQMHLTGSGFMTSETVPVSTKNENSHNDTSTKHSVLNAPESHPEPTSHSAISNSQPYDKKKYFEKSASRATPRTCFRCGSQLDYSQKRFCSNMCRELSSKEMGFADVHPDNINYDYSNYDPEDEKYGGV